MYYYEGFPEYVSVGERKAENAAKLVKYLAKHPLAMPIAVEGNQIARTWWGKAWNENLESYADFANRMDRGRSYLRTGAVYDLQIKQGQIEAVVQGSEKKPYQITITIDPLGKKQWQKIVAHCEGCFDSLQELLRGDFPKDLGKFLLQKGEGLFPNLKEIHLSCSCPDSAWLCKHIAAALYRVGAKLDQDPALFFTLRAVAVDDLITQALGSDVTALLEKAENPGSRIMDEADVAELFGL